MKKTYNLILLFTFLLVVSSCVTTPEDNLPDETEVTICTETFDDKMITFCDDFESADNPNAQGVDLSKWAFQTGDGSQYGIPGWGNNEAQYYREENAFVEGGYLNIQLKNEAFGGKGYTSARLWTNNIFSQTYGRFEASIKLPLGNGLWPAFWLLPDNTTYGTWAANGEIDIMEAKGRLPYEASGAIHYGGQWPNNTYSFGTYTFPLGQSINEFHTYAIEWEENVIRWYINDNLFYQTSDWYSENGAYPAPFDTSFYIILNLAVGGTFDGGQLPDASIFNEDVLMQLEYVRVFQYFK
jgi:beta-glucanase (GH16 family)